MHSPHFHHSFGLAFIAMGLALGSAVFASGPLYARTYLQPLLTVSAGNAPDASILLDATTNARVATFLFTARRENVTVETITLQNCIADQDEDADCADASETLGNDAATSAVTASYVNHQGALETVSGTLTNGSLTLTGLDFAVGNGETAILTIFVDTPAFDGATVTSGAQFQMNLNAKAGTFLATGDRSDLSITESNIKRNIMSNVMTLRDAEPVFRLAEGSPVGKMSLGQTEVLRFTVQPDEKRGEQFSLSALMFALQTSDQHNTNWNTCHALGIAPHNFILTNNDTGEVVAADVVTYSTAGEACASTPDGPTSLVHFTFTETLTIDEKTTLSFSIKSNGASDDGHDSVRASIPDQTKLDRMDNGIDALTWSDGSSTLNGDSIDYLPVKGKRITFH